MRPRLIAVDDGFALHTFCDDYRASMRPRLIAVDDEGSDADAQAGLGFNEATAYCRG